jgi:hypothetical protein
LREEQRLTKGWRYEPATFYEKNPAAQALHKRPKPFRLPRQVTAGAPLVPPQPALKQ